MQPATLASLAILKVNWDNKGHDYADNFLPFVVEAIQQGSSEEISVADVQKQIREGFGLIIPQGALNTLLRRAERRGAIKREHGVFRRHSSAEDSNFQLQRAEINRRQSALLTKLTEFAADKYGLSWSEADAEQALLHHLQDSCIPILAAVVDGCPIPTVERAVPHADFVVNSFTVHLFNSDPEGFAFLETVAKGNILATALFVPEITKTDKRFQNLTVYLDTRILLRALGLEGPQLQEPAREFLTLLYEMNVNLACFDVTLNEVRRILDAAQNALRDPSLVRRGLYSVFEHFISIGVRASDVELIISRLEVSLRALHINVKDLPRHEVELTLNETRLGEILHDLLPSQGEEAQRHDVDCITAIHRLRRGRQRSDIESCGYIFVTTNNALARVASIYFIEEHERLTVPLCINDHIMSTLAWVKNPKLQQDWARKKLIADSYAALHPGPELWKKYNNEISKLQENKSISDQEYNLLRFSLVARNALMDSTLGSPDAFTEGTAQQVLEAARLHILREADERLAQEKQKREVLEARLVDQTREIDAAKRLRRQRVEEIASFFGTTAMWICYSIFAAIICFCIWYTLPRPIGPETPWSSWLAPLALLIFAAFSAANLFEGGTIRGLSRNVEVYVSAAVERFLVRLLSL